MYVIKLRRDYNIWYIIFFLKTNRSCRSLEDYYTDTHFHFLLIPFKKNQGTDSSLPNIHFSQRIGRLYKCQNRFRPNKFWNKFGRRCLGLFGFSSRSSRKQRVRTFSKLSCSRKLLVWSTTRRRLSRSELWLNSFAPQVSPWAQWNTQKVSNLCNKYKKRPTGSVFSL